MRYICIIGLKSNNFNVYKIHVVVEMVYYFEYYFLHISIEGAIDVSSKKRANVLRMGLTLHRKRLLFVAGFLGSLTQ